MSKQHSNFKWTHRNSMVSLVIVILLHISSQNVNSQQQVLPKQLVSIDELPELFDDDKLPNKETNATECFKYIGCFDKIPNVGHSPSDPNDIGAEFIVITRESVTTIPFEETNNCLASQPNTCDTYPFSLEHLKKSNFNPQLQTVILTSGFRTMAPCGWQRDIKDRWLKLRNVNVIITCWNKGSHDIYGKSSANTRVIARQITVLLYYLARLNDRQLDDAGYAENIYLVGHSLGAHISGFVGQDFGGQVGRITGLDPAGPNFINLDKRFRLDKTDAQFVDALHTNGGKSSLTEINYGLADQVGHLDYYANNGQKQPSCSHNILGCSHKIAPTYYLSFLEHELNLRTFLGEGYHNGHRIFAYRSDTYESFVNGTSFSQLCPITSLDDSDLYSSDINRCVIPVDYVSEPASFRHELSERYAIDFDSPEYKPEQKFYFLTKKQIPYLNNHNLIKIRITKSTNKDLVRFSQVCSISLELANYNGVQTKEEIKAYKLMDKDDHFEILMPYVSVESSSIYELAKMDSNDYYLNETSHVKLTDGLSNFFPLSISIKGIGSSRTGSLVDRIKNAYRNFFGLGQQDSMDDDSEESKNICDVNMETVVVQPMKKAHRHLVATYTIAAKHKGEPDIVILKEGDASPKVELFKGKRPESTVTSDKPRESENSIYQAGDDDEGDKSESKVFVDTVIIGPFDKSYAANLPEETSYNQDDLRDDPCDDVRDAENQFDAPRTSRLSRGSWLISTALLLSAALLVTTAVVYNRWMVWVTIRRRWRKEDRNVLVNEDQCENNTSWANRKTNQIGE